MCKVNLYGLGVTDMREFFKCIVMIPSLNIPSAIAFSWVSSGNKSSLNQFRLNSNTPYCIIKYTHVL